MGNDQRGAWPHPQRSETREKSGVRAYVPLVMAATLQPQLRPRGLFPAAASQVSVLRLPPWSLQVDSSRFQPLLPQIFPCPLPNPLTWSILQKRVSPLNPSTHLSQWAPWQPEPDCGIMFIFQKEVSSAHITRSLPTGPHQAGRVHTVWTTVQKAFCACADKGHLGFVQSTP